MNINTFENNSNTNYFAFFTKNVFNMNTQKHVFAYLRIHKNSARILHIPYMSW